MSDRHHTTDDARPTTSEEEEVVARLLEQAGPAHDVPADHLSQIKAAFRSEWQAHVAARREARRIVTRRALLAAAALVLAVLAGWGLLEQRAQPARVERVVGIATLHPSGENGAGTRLGIGTPVPAGAAVDTASAAGGDLGRAALRLAGGASLRLDRDTRIRLVSSDLVELERGAVYVDSGIHAHGAVAVHTPLGTARDLGTQFEVRLLEGLGGSPRMQVRVREGLVQVALDGAASRTGHEVEAGGEVIVHTGGRVEVGQVPTFGGEWEWILDIAPPFDEEGGSLAELLDWAARETGWTIRYEDETLASSAAEIPLLGALADVRPEETRDLIRSAGLASRLEDGVLVVERPSGEH